MAILLFFHGEKRSLRLLLEILRTGAAQGALIILRQGVPLVYIAADLAHIAVLTLRLLLRRGRSLYVRRQRGRQPLQS